MPWAPFWVKTAKFSIVQYISIYSICLSAKELARPEALQFHIQTLVKLFLIRNIYRSPVTTFCANSMATILIF
jgi:hypothetical protein